MTISNFPGQKLGSIPCIEVLRCRGTAGWLWPRHHSLAWWTLETMSALRCVKCLVLWFTFFGHSFGSAQVCNKCQCISRFRFNCTSPRIILQAQKIQPSLPWGCLWWGLLPTGCFPWKSPNHAPKYSNVFFLRTQDLSMGWSGRFSLKLSPPQQHTSFSVCFTKRVFWGGISEASNTRFGP